MDENVDVDENERQAEEETGSKEGRKEELMVLMVMAHGCHFVGISLALPFSLSVSLSARNC